MEHKPKIIIADTQFLTLNSMVQMIESEKKYTVCGLAENMEDLLRLLKADIPDLLITDINLFDYDSPDDLKLIIQEHHIPAVLILTNRLTNIEVGMLLRAGFKNISLKTDEREDLLSSIEMSLKQQKQISGQILLMLTDRAEEKDHDAESSVLTQSELEIVKLIAEGYTTKEIALKKHNSFHTVMTHRKNIFRKLGINNVSELIRFAVRNGLTDYLEYNI